MKKYVYDSKEIVSNEILGYNMINYFLDTFVPIVLDENTKLNEGYNGKILSGFSKNYRFTCDNLIKNGNCTKEYYKLLLVTDYICGMTDSYAAHIYKELKGIRI